jgi:hypothetical protein
MSDMKNNAANALCQSPNHRTPPRLYHLISISRVRKLGFLSGMLAFAAIAWASNDPWMTKPYQQWNESDIQRVLTDSPWSRMVTVTRTWSSIKAGELPEGALAGGRRTLSTETSQSNDPMATKDVSFGIFWMSSRVTRAAAARRAILQSRMTEANAQKYIDQPQPEYEIVVQGGDMAPFLQKDEKFFKENAFLEMKKTKQTISPNHVQYQRSPDGKSLYAVKFYFPKKSSAGDPLISTDEKIVEFLCRLEGPTLRADFEPVKMADQNGPAL